MNCKRCERPMRCGSRRFRCDTCKRLVCVKCCNAGGSGQGQGARRWAECFDCQETREQRSNGRDKCPGCDRWIKIASGPSDFANHKNPSTGRWCSQARSPFREDTE